MKAKKSITTFQAIRLKRLALYLLNHWPVLMLCSLAAFVLLWGLGKSSLDDWDEAIYAQISKEMVQSGDWLTLHWEYKPWFEKPPLFMWSTAVFYKLFVINEFWSRAASAFSGIGLIFITYLIGKTIYNRWVGFFATIILLTSYQFVASARFGTTDIMLTLFTFLAVYGYLRLGKNDQKWWYMIWISCALALMVKSAAGLVGPVTITLALLLDRRLVATAKSRHFWQGLLLALVIVIPWHLTMCVQHGQAFIEEYLGQHILSRSWRAMERHIGDRYFYVWGLQYHYFPWFYLVPFALALGIRENIRGQPRSRLPLLLFMLVFGLYTMIQTKLYWYIVPLFPALAILTASVIMQAFRSYRSGAYSGLVVSTLAVTLVAPLKLVVTFGGLGLLAIFCYLGAGKLAYQLNEPIGFVMDGLRTRQRENARIAITASITDLLAVFMCVFLVVVGINELRPLYQAGVEPVAKLARIAGESTPDAQESLIVASGLSQPAPLFYSNRPIQVAYDLKDISDFIEDDQAREIILAKDDTRSLLTHYEIHVLVESEPLVYAMIKPKAASRLGEVDR